MTELAGQNPENQPGLYLVGSHGEAMQQPAVTADIAREKSRDQTGLWSQLPELAIYAYDKNTEESHDSPLYDHGLLAIAVEDSTQPRDLKGVYIDCATGNILRLHGLPENGKVKSNKLASDDEVLDVQSHGAGELLNAWGWVGYYHTRLEKIIASNKTYGAPNEWQDLQDWRREKLKNLGLIDN